MLEKGQGGVDLYMKTRGMPSRDIWFLDVREIRLAYEGIATTVSKDFIIVWSTFFDFFAACARDRRVGSDSKRWTELLTSLGVLYDFRREYC